MAKYVCTNCDMQINNVTCGKCDSDLEFKTIAKDDGSTVNVSECPNGHGKIKSPTCCGHDMSVHS